MATLRKPQRNTGVRDPRTRPPLRRTRRVLSGLAVVTLTTGLACQQKLTASDKADGDHFGYSVAVGGGTALVGARYDDDLGSSSGSAYVFVRSGAAWTEQQKLTASDGMYHDQFGHSVSVDGNTAVVGADQDDDMGSDSGSTYVFVRSGTTWTEQQKLTASDGAEDDRFGDTVALDGDTVVVGARLTDELGPDSGSAYVFVRSGTTWTQQQKLTASDGASDDRFGYSVAVDADTAVVGAPLTDDLGSNSGSAYVFLRSGTTWTQQQKLTASDGAESDRFGYSVSLDGDTVAVGATLTGDFGSTGTGAVYVFVRSGTTWAEQQKLTASDGVQADGFGDSVALAGDTAVVGASADDDLGGSSGSVYVFVRRGTSWRERYKLTASDGGELDEFGLSVSLDGNTALVGAPERAQNYIGYGSAYVIDITLLTLLAP